MQLHRIQPENVVVTFTDSFNSSSRLSRYVCASLHLWQDASCYPRSLCPSRQRNQQLARDRSDHELDTSIGECIIASLPTDSIQWSDTFCSHVITRYQQRFSSQEMIHNVHHSSTQDRYVNKSELARQVRTTTMYPSTRKITLAYCLTATNVVSSPNQPQPSNFGNQATMRFWYYCRHSPKVA
jgi:hypothetical protein